jgi:MFS family permease
MPVPTRGESLYGEVPRAARTATARCYFVHGFVFSSWAPRIPWFKTSLGLTDGALGLALLGPPTGAVLAMWAAGFLTGRAGAVPVIRASLTACCLVGALVPLAGGLPALFGVLAVWGGTGSALDVALNTHGAAVEQRYGRPIMSALHATWTAGALAGSAVGAASAAMAVPPDRQFAAVGAAGLAIGLLPTRSLPVDGPAPRDPPPPVPVVPSVVPSVGDLVPVQPTRSAGTAPGSAGRPRPERRLVILCLICLSSFLCEGIAGDWSSVYLRDVTGASAGVAGLGYVGFAMAMLAIRVVGDRVVRAVGAVRTVRVSAGAAGVVFALAVAAGGTPLGTVAGIVGFASIGAGMACVVPTTISAAARAGTGTDAAAIAVVVSGGYVGWLAGPPLIGGLADLVGLHGTVGIVTVFAAGIAFLAPALGGPATRPR